MTSNPSDVGHACKPVFGMNVKDVLDGHDGAEQVTSGRVNDALWLSSRAGGLMKTKERSESPVRPPTRPMLPTHVEDKQRIFTAHDLGCAVGWNFCTLFVPPEITTLGHWDLGAGSLENQDPLDQWTFLESRVND